MIYDEKWPTAIGISFSLHVVLLITLGLVAGQIHTWLPPEQYMVIDMVAPDVSSRSVVDPTSQQAPAPILDAPVQIGVRADAPSSSRPMTSTPTSFPLKEVASMGEAGTTTTRSISTDMGYGGNDSAASNNTAPAIGTPPATIGSGNIDEINAFLAKIEQYKEYPYLARRRGQEGTAVLLVRISPSGELTGLEVVRSSGVEALDEAAEKVVRRICPFSHDSGKMLAMRIPISYQLE